jgi:hypothetical protein
VWQNQNEPFFKGFVRYQGRSPSDFWAFVGYEDYRATPLLGHLTMFACSIESGFLLFHLVLGGL